MTVTTRRIAGIVAAIGAVGLATARAQQPTPQQMKAMQEQRLKALGVTPAQKAKMAAIDRKYMPKLQALQRQMQALILQGQKETMAVLTPAQRAKLQQMNAQAMQRR